MKNQKSKFESLNREVMKGFYLFLHSESQRHRKDIEKIEAKLKWIEEEIELTPHEIGELVRMSLKFVDIEE